MPSGCRARLRVCLPMNCRFFWPYQSSSLGGQPLNQPEMLGLSFQEDAIGIRLRDVIGVDNMMWGSDYPHSESTFPQSRKILAEILKGVPDDEQAKIVGGNTARVYGFDVARLTVPA
jgi:hypothetical protein